MLGVKWFPKDDQFSFTYDASKHTTNLTKREIVRQMAEFYDPIGQVQPVMVIGKILIQTLWLLKVGWDDDIPDDIKSKWRQYQSELVHLNKLTNGIQ